MKLNKNVNPEFKGLDFKNKAVFPKISDLVTLYPHRTIATNYPMKKEEEGTPIQEIWPISYTFHTEFQYLLPTISYYIWAAKVRKIMRWQQSSIGRGKPLLVTVQTAITINQHIPYTLCPAQDWPASPSKLL